MSDSRDRIVAAATAMVREGTGARPTVRAVAARAGVGASTLRHYFPTQQALYDAVLDSIYETGLPDERIHDTSVPAAVRLVECMRNFLNPLDNAEHARELYRHLFRTLIDSEIQAPSRDAYRTLARQARQRIKSWLGVLAEEGALPRGDHTAQAVFLLTVLDGLAIGRALAAGGPSPDEEAAVLETAAETVLGTRNAD